MKQLAFLFFLPVSLAAQTRQGHIVYERKIDVHRRVQDEQMKAMVPQFQTAAYEILFRDSITVYRAMPKEEGPDPFETNTGGGVHINLKFGGPGDDGIVYRNYNSSRVLEEASIADKKYIITDSLRQLPWKLTDDTVTILGHSCKKATTTTPRGGKVLAWYANDIPMPVGPDQFFGLPGAILKVDIDDATVVFIAKEIHDKVQTSDLKAPTGARLITRADFNRKLDETFGPADAQGRRIIRN